MPEGPEVKTVATSLSKPLVSKVLGDFWLSGYDLRTKLSKETLNLLVGKSVTEVNTHGKVIFIKTKNDFEFGLMAQLGMTGALTVEEKNSEIKPHTHLRWQLLNSSLELRYRDVRRFGLIDVYDEDKKKQVLNKLGQDPFSWSQKDWPSIINRFKKSSRSIKEALLDQSIIAGVGNIYASECLYLSQINPQKTACDISENEYIKLLNSVEKVLKEAYRNGGTTFSDFVDGQGNKGKNSAHLKVFQKAKTKCSICGELIVKITQGGRSSFFCLGCQP